MIWFGNKPVFRKKSCIKQLKQFSGVSIGCQDSLSVEESLYVYLTSASRCGNLNILALSGAEQGCAEDALAQCSGTGLCDHHQS